MWPALVLALQSAAPEAQPPASLPTPLPPPPLVLDLLAPIRLLRCPDPGDNVIVVCGRRPGEEDRLFFRRNPWAPREPAPEARDRGGITIPL
jgi:hypothetical protein